MIKEGYYINKEDKLVKRFEKIFKTYDKKLSIQYGIEFSKTIQKTALVYFKELIPKIPHYTTISYQEIILLNAHLIAIIRAMNIGLKQPNTIENGKCVFCMKYKGMSEIPESLNVIYGNV